MERVLKTGTTVVGIKGKDFVVLATERQVTLGPMRFSQMRKLYKVYEDVWVGIAGNVADFQQIARILEVQAKLFEIDRERKPSVKNIVTLLSHLLYSGRFSFFPYQAQILIGGKDEEGFHLYSMDPYGGTTEEKYTAWGSGVLYAMPVLDASYRDDIKKEEAIKLAINAISASLKRDIYSGYDIDVVVIDKEGSRLLSKEEIENVIRSASSEGGREKTRKIH